MVGVSFDGFLGDDRKVLVAPYDSDSRCPFGALQFCNGFLREINTCTAPLENKADSTSRFQRTKHDHSSDLQQVMKVTNKETWREQWPLLSSI